MMTAECMLSACPVLRITAALFFYFVYVRFILIIVYNTFVLQIVYLLTAVIADHVSILPIIIRTRSSNWTCYDVTMFRCSRCRDISTISVIPSVVRPALLACRLGGCGIVSPPEPPLLEENKICPNMTFDLLSKLPLECAVQLRTPSFMIFLSRGFFTIFLPLSFCQQCFSRRSFCRVRFCREALLQLLSDWHAVRSLLFTGCKGRRDPLSMSSKLEDGDSPSNLLPEDEILLSSQSGEAVVMQCLWNMFWTWPELFENDRSPLLTLNLKLTDVNFRNDRLLDTVVTYFVDGGVGLKFDFWAGQIGHSVANSSPPLRRFFRSSVVQALSYVDRPCHSLHSSM